MDGYRAQGVPACSGWKFVINAGLILVLVTALSKTLSRKGCFEAISEFWS